MDVNLGRIICVLTTELAVFYQDMEIEDDADNVDMADRQLSSHKNRESTPGGAINSPLH